MSLSSLAGLQADLHDICAQSRGDAGEVEPIHALEDLIPVEVRGLSQLDSAVSTVVDADRAALRSALLVVVDAHTVAAADDHAGVHTVTAQAVDSGLANSVCGELGDESSIQAVVSQRNCNVGLAAAEGELQAVSLDKALVVERLQTNHQFAKSNDFHCGILLLVECFIYPCRKAKVPLRCVADAGADQAWTRWKAKPAISSAK